MSPTHCPLCLEALEVRDVGPCMECGSIAREIEEAQQGKHTFAEYRIFGDLSLVLCNFCQADFSSYDPTFFGLTRGKRIGMESGLWRFVRDVEPVITKDKFARNVAIGFHFLNLWRAHGSCTAQRTVEKCLGKSPFAGGSSAKLRHHGSF